MDHDPVLRDTLFRRVKAFMFAGAGLAQPIWNKLDAHGEAAIGERVRIITGLGMTETAPSCTFAVGTDVRSGHIGLPVPGVEVKLVPMGDKTEVRFRGPNVMPGYWRAPEQTAEAFDDEGFYRTGDAVKWVDAAQPGLGLMFDGRIAEDFKLSTGTFVSVGPLRAKIIQLGDPCVQDAVITGINRDEVGALIVPRVDACRRLAGLSAGAPTPDVLHHAAVREFFQTLADRLWRDVHRQRQPRRPAARAGRAAVDRQGRDHRQGLDQPARGAEPPRRAGRGPVRRRLRRPVPDPAALNARCIAPTHRRPTKETPMKLIKTLLAAAMAVAASGAALADVNIGVSLSLTGPGSGLGIPMQNQFKSVAADDRRREGQPDHPRRRHPTRARASAMRAASSPKTRST